MRNPISILILILFISIQIFAQEKLLTVEDVVINAYTKLSVQNLQQLSWLPSSDSYVYVDKSGNSSSILKFGIKSQNADSLLTLDELNSHLEKMNFKKLNSFTQLNWQTQTSFYFWNGNIRLLYDIKYKNLTKLNSVDEEADNKTISPNSKYAAYTKSNNLFVNLDNAKTDQISFDTDTNIVNGQSVHRNEFGIEGGIFWSPNSNFIAYYRMDQTMVTDYPLVDINNIPASLKNIKYPMAVKIVIMSQLVSMRLKPEDSLVETGEPLDQYFTCLTWSPTKNTLRCAS